MRIILLGAPGAGKGTQAMTLANSLNSPHIATGDLFRAALSQGTPLGVEAKKYMDKGELVPDSVTVNMLLDRISDPDADNGYILDGFPRTVKQAEALDKALIEREEAIDMAILVDVSEDELVERLTGRWICRVCQRPYHAQNNPPLKQGVCDLDSGDLYQRDDDKPDTVRNRLKIYDSETSPLISFFENQGKLSRINGEQEIDQVENQLINLIKSK
jgi:adenylate kinase